MTSVHGSSTHAFARPRAFVASTSHLPRKNSGISSAATPVLSSFAIDLIAQVCSRLEEFSICRQFDLQDLVLLFCCSCCPTQMAMCVMAPLTHTSLVMSATTCYCATQRNGRKGVRKREKERGTCTTPYHPKTK